MEHEGVWMDALKWNMKVGGWMFSGALEWKMKVGGWTVLFDSKGVRQWRMVGGVIRICVNPGDVRH